MARQYGVKYKIRNIENTCSITITKIKILNIRVRFKLNLEKIKMPI